MGTSPRRTEEKYQPLFGGKPIGTWTATEPTQRAGWGGSRSASPPNPGRALVLHRGGGAGGQGELEEQVLPHSGQRHLLPNGIPFLPPPTFAITRLSWATARCTRQEVPSSQEQGCATQARLRRGASPAGGHPECPGAQVPHTLSLLESTCPSLVTPFGLPALHQWHRPFRPRAPEPPTGASRWCCEKSFSGQTQGGGGEGRRRGGRRAWDIPPPHPEWFPGQKPLHLSPHRAMSAAKAWLVERTL